MNTIRKATLYVVATPIGNLSDMTVRACEILNGVELILAEDTRHSIPLLKHYSISTPLRSFHEFNADAQVNSLVKKMQLGASLALISDAGTPLISDPGFVFVDRALSCGLKVLPVPGPSALTAALSVAGLPTDRFSFEGFLPARAAARQRQLQGLVDEPRTMVFFEAPHRLETMLADLQQCFGGERRITLARELSKHYETVIRSDIEGLRRRLKEEPEQCRGEMILVVGGAPRRRQEDLTQAARVLALLSAELPRSRAVALTAEITGMARNRLYRHALKDGDS